MNHAVYVIRLGDYIKVGQTMRLYARLGKHSYDSKEDSVIISIRFFESKDSAVDMEDYLIYLLRLSKHTVLGREYGISTPKIDSLIKRALHSNINLKSNRKRHIKSAYLMGDVRFPEKIAERFFEMVSD